MLERSQRSGIVIVRLWPRKMTDKKLKQILEWSRTSENDCVHVSRCRCEARRREMVLYMASQYFSWAAAIYPTVIRTAELVYRNQIHLHTHPLLRFVHRLPMTHVFHHGGVVITSDIRHSFSTEEGRVSTWLWRMWQSLQLHRYSVIFRIVCREIHNDCFMQAFRSCQGLMTRNLYFPYLIRAVEIR